jgi:hypothetical protein
MTVVQNLDPTYLRYIHDGLNNGTIHAENASSLPDGLTGLYESSFLGDLNVKDSQSLLKRFALLAYFCLLLMNFQIAYFQHSEFVEVLTKIIVLIMKLSR